MAMPPGNVIPSEKMQFPAVPPGAGHWIPDERDGFISWLRAEFAAANAIIDLFCQHLRAIGDPGEYDGVIMAIQQRRFNWSAVLHMQQYFPVADVAYTLQPITWKRQQQLQPHSQSHLQSHFVLDQGNTGGREFRRSGAGFNKHAGQRGSEVMVKEGQNSNVERHSVDRIEKPEEAKSGGGNTGKDMDENAFSVAEEKRVSGTGGSGKPKADGRSSKSSGNLDESEGTDSETQVVVNHKCNSDSKNNSLTSEQKQEMKENPPSRAKTFVVTEIYEGKTVNVVEGLRLYNELLEKKEVSQLVSLVNELRVSGKRGQLQGQSYVVYKRPMKGHGREMIQLGLPITDAPVDDEVPSGTSRDRRVEPIPTLLQDVIERLVGMQLMPVKPDACIVDFYNEGDHSQPHMFVPWFGRPVCLMFLSECDMTFGRVVVSDHPGDYRGSLKLSLTPGSLLVMEGKSADLAKHAIHSIRKHRTLITFTKSQPKKTITGPNWAPSPSRSPNHIRHHSAPPKHYPPIPATGVLPTPPPPRPPNGVVQPLFIPAPLAPPPPMAFPAPPVASGVPHGSTSWPPVPPPPRHPPPPRMPLPGTGVFLPPGSGDPCAREPGFLQEKENGSSWKPDNGGSASAEVKVDEKGKEEAGNGGVTDGCNGGKATLREDRGSGAKQSS